jgi:GMP synthase-like glutamine amidotransferase
MNVLLISTCAEKLHELEFVKPVEDIVKGNCDYEIKNYGEVDLDFVKGFDKVIICGTSLRDDGFLGDLGVWGWLREFGGAVLGICAGMQVLGAVFGGETKKKKEIGYYFENFSNEFLGLSGKPEVWHLHNSYVDFNRKEWDIFCESEEIAQAVKHKEKDFYGVLFHPEVRQKEMIKNFLRI